MYPPKRSMWYPLTIAILILVIILIYSFAVPKTEAIDPADYEAPIYNISLDKRRIIPGYLY